MLSVFVDVSRIYGCLFKDNSDLDLVSYPYVYSQSLLSNYVTEGAFYREILADFCKKNSVDIDKTPIFAAGILSAPKIDAKNVTNIDLHEVMTYECPCFPVVVSPYVVATPDDFVSRAPISSYEDSVSQLDFLSNLCLYPTLGFPHCNSPVNINKFVSEMVAKTPLDFPSDLPLIFSGSLFGDYISKDLFYILMFSLIQKEGIYDLRLDTKSILLLTKIVHFAQKEATYSEQEAFKYLESVGHYIRAYGDVELLVEVPSGYSKLIEVKKDDFTIIPLTKDSQATITVKSHGINSTTKKITAGTFGIIVDTRQKRESIFSDIKLFNSLTKKIRSLLI